MSRRRGWTVRWNVAALVSKRLDKEHYASCSEFIITVLKTRLCSTNFVLLVFCVCSGRRCLTEKEVKDNHASQITKKKFLHFLKRTKIYLFIRVKKLACRIRHSTYWLQRSQCVSSFSFCTGTVKLHKTGWNVLRRLFLLKLNGVIALIAQYDEQRHIQKVWQLKLCSRLIGQTKFNLSCLSE